jgi:hypothetical protein
VADIKSEQAAGFKSVHMAGFTLECLAGPVGICIDAERLRAGAASRVAKAQAARAQPSEACTAALYH